MFSDREDVCVMLVSQSMSRSVGEWFRERATHLKRLKTSRVSFEGFRVGNL